MSSITLYSVINYCKIETMSSTLSYNFIRIEITKRLK